MPFLPSIQKHQSTVLVVVVVVVVVFLKLMSFAYELFMAPIQGWLEFNFLFQHKCGYIRDRAILRARCSSRVIYFKWLGKKELAQGDSAGGQEQYFADADSGILDAVHIVATWRIRSNR